MPINLSGAGFYQEIRLAGGFKIKSFEIALFTFESSIFRRAVPVKNVS